MMEQNPARPARKVAIADPIWEAYESMAHQMGTDRDGLINQAMFMFARLNGFLDTSGSARAGSGRAAASNGLGVSNLKGGMTGQRPGPPVLAVSSKDSGMHSRRSSADDKSHKLDDDPVRREVAERVLETAAELERLIKGKNDPHLEEPLSGSMPEEEADPVDDMDSAGLDDGDAIEDEGRGNQLYLMAEGGELDKIAKDRFVIGRGKHCDFVINSGKVSREHAVITRENGEYYIEDLGSSNGTWFNKQRIKRRKVEDGDEYYICSEKIKLVTR